MPSAATWIDLEIIILIEVSQTKTKTNITYLQNLKKWYKPTYLQNRNRLINIENKPMITKGGRGGGEG